MKVKRILKFYFSAGCLEKTFDALIMSKACASALNPAGGGQCAESILSLIEEKRELARLWRYVDGVFAGLTERDGETLKRYADYRGGLDGLDCETRREFRRAAVKFGRRARRADSYKEGLGLVGKYYCLLR